LRLPFGTLSRVAPFEKEVRIRAIAQGPAPIEGQGAPVRTPVYVAVSGGDVTEWRGRGIMFCEEERALIDLVCGFGHRTKRAR
jgi:hypothetical protein